MNASALAQTAYGPTAAGAKSERETEYQVFARVTGALAAASRSGEMKALARATTDNIRLWAALAADVALPGNGLPKETRAMIVNLAAFSQIHGLRVLGGDGSVQALIDVNTSVMKGLRGPGGAR